MEEEEEEQDSIGIPAGNIIGNTESSYTPRNPTNHASSGHDDLHQKMVMMMGGMMMMMMLMMMMTMMMTMTMTMMIG